MYGSYGSRRGRANKLTPAIRGFGEYRRTHNLILNNFGGSNSGPVHRGNREADSSIKLYITEQMPANCKRAFDSESIRQRNEGEPTTWNRVAIENGKLSPLDLKQKITRRAGKRNFVETLPFTWRKPVEILRSGGVGREET